MYNVFSKQSSLSNFMKSKIRGLKSGNQKNLLGITIALPLLSSRSIHTVIIRRSRGLTQ